MYPIKQLRFQQTYFGQLTGIARSLLDFGLTIDFCDICFLGRYTFGRFHPGGFHPASFHLCCFYSNGFGILGCRCGHFNRFGCFFRRD